jgi:AraC family transcriptional regulator
MAYLRQVQRGIDYIESHLDADIATADVAREAGISHWHFQRIFKGLTNETLGAYIRSRRMAGARQALEAGRERILDIALAAGFETQESFTRAFKKAFAVTPAWYRKHGGRLQFVRKARFDEEYLRHIHQNVSLEPELYQQAELQLVGMHTRFFSVDSEKNNMARKLPALWRQFLDRLDEVPHTVGPTGYGVIRQTPAQTDELDYFAVVEVARVGPVPKGMVHLTLPAARYARFAHRGLVANLDRTVNYIYATWLGRAGLRHTYGADLEIYGPEYVPDAEQSVISYAIPVGD